MKKKMSKQDKTLEKCEELISRLTELKKALGDQVNVASNRKPMNSLGTGWSMDSGTGSFHHSAHGVISTSKRPDGQYQITHGGRSVGRVKDMAEAGARIKNYVSTLHPTDTGSHSVNPMAKEEDDEMDKSNYGPKGSGQYDVADNAKRKARNVGDVIDTGKNVNVKAYSTKPGQLSSKAQAAMEAKNAKKLSGPVIHYTPAQIAAINEARNLKKSFEEKAWVTHSNVPSADEEVVKLQATNPVEQGENALANQLANLMLNKAMLGNKPPRQPTNEEMFGHLVPSEQQLAKSQQDWTGAINNWIAEATKPISQRFSSEEEEIEYWNSIKVANNKGDDYGY